MNPRLVVAAWLTAAAAAAHAQNPCGPLENHYGPYDYRSQKEQLRIVEKFHFTPPVELLLRGESTHIGGDLAYTLATSPNHHRALVATTRLGEKLKTTKIDHMPYSIECYYERAIRFQAEDTIVRNLYAQFLGKKGRTDDAIKQLEVVTGLAGDNGFTHYNVGLVYLELGQPERALQSAWKAQELGFMRPELKDLLVKAGQWREPPAKP
jgi:tetratricopeptide (TPR) repeat protein